MVELSDNGFAYLSKELEHSVVTRQSAIRVYAMNASIYCWHRALLKMGFGMEMQSYMSCLASAPSMWTMKLTFG